MFDNQHECQAFVGSSVSRSKPARMRVTLFANSKCICVGSSRDQGWGIDKHPSGESSLSRAAGRSYLLRFLSHRIFVVLFGLAMRPSFKPQTLIHELARLFRSVVEWRCHISDSHLEREDSGVLRAVSRLECEMVPLGFFEIPFYPPFLL